MANEIGSAAGRVCELRRGQALGFGGAGALDYCSQSTASTRRAYFVAQLDGLYLYCARWLIDLVCRPIDKRANSVEPTHADVLHSQMIGFCAILCTDWIIRSVAIIKYDAASRHLPHTASVAHLFQIPFVTSHWHSADRAATPRHIALLVLEIDIVAKRVADPAHRPCHDDLAGRGSDLCVCRRIAVNAVFINLAALGPHLEVCGAASVIPSVGADTSKHVALSTVFLSTIRINDLKFMLTAGRVIILI